MFGGSSSNASKRRSFFFFKGNNDSSSPPATKTDSEYVAVKKNGAIIVEKSAKSGLKSSIKKVESSVVPSGGTSSRSLHTTPSISHSPGTPKIVVPAPKINGNLPSDVKVSNVRQRSTRPPPPSIPVDVINSIIIEKANKATINKDTDIEPLSVGRENNDETPSNNENTVENRQGHQKQQSETELLVSDIDEFISSHQDFMKNGLQPTSVDHLADRISGFSVEPLSKDVLNSSYEYPQFQTSSEDILLLELTETKKASNENEDLIADFTTSNKTGSFSFTGSLKSPSADNLQQINGELVDTTTITSTKYENNEHDGTEDPFLNAINAGNASFVRGNSVAHSTNPFRSHSGNTNTDQVNDKMNEINEIEAIRNAFGTDLYSNEELVSSVHSDNNDFNSDDEEYVADDTSQFVERNSSGARVYRVVNDDPSNSSSSSSSDNSSSNIMTSNGLNDASSPSFKWNSHSNLIEEPSSYKQDSFPTSTNMSLYKTDIMSSVTSNDTQLQDMLSNTTSEIIGESINNNQSTTSFKTDNQFKEVDIRKNIRSGNCSPLPSSTAASLKSEKKEPYVNLVSNYVEELRLKYYPTSNFLQAPPNLPITLKQKNNLIQPKHIRLKLRTNAKQVGIKHGKVKQRLLALETTNEENTSTGDAMFLKDNKKLVDHTKEFHKLMNKEEGYYGTDSSDEDDSNNYLKAIPGDEAYNSDDAMAPLRTTKSATPTRSGTVVSYYTKQNRKMRSGTLDNSYASLQKLPMDILQAYDEKADQVSDKKSLKIEEEEQNHLYHDTNDAGSLASYTPQAMLQLVNPDSDSD